MSAALLPVYPRLDIDLVGARGCTLLTADGRELVDLYGGHAVTPLGHAHPRLEAALIEGYRSLDFYSNSLRMAVQQEAAEALLAPSEHLAYAHLVNSGAEANESAIHLARRLSGRTKILAFDCSFHGRTLACLQATGLAGYRARCAVPPLPEHNGWIRFGEAEDLARIDGETAAVICESVPSLAGVLMPPEGYYAALEARCREVGALLIFDEVQGGVGRLGERWYAHQRFGVAPDMVTLAKSLAGGFPAGALLVSQALGDQVEYGELGTTFGGGPLACRMISATARAITELGLLSRVPRIFARVRDGLAGLEGVSVRGAGCLIGVQTPRPAKELRAALLERDLITGTSAEPHSLRLLPPYVISDGELDRFVDAARELLA